MSVTRLAAGLATLLCAGVRAAWAFHRALPDTPRDVARLWSVDPGAMVVLGTVAMLWVRGLRGVRGAARRRTTWAFAAGWTTLALAVVSPLHALGETLFAAHMVQHEVLMLVAAPLLVLGRPLPVLGRGLPRSWRRGIGRLVRRGRPVRRLWDTCTEPATAWALHAAALWCWHAPAAFDAALRSPLVHALQHATFLGTALLFWWPILQERAVVAVVALFTTSIHTAVLGALLTLAPHRLYAGDATRIAAWGLTPLADQQLGGLVMWIPGGLVYLGIALWCAAGALRETDRRWHAVAAGALPLLVIMLPGCSDDVARRAAADTGGEPERGRVALRVWGCASCHEIPGVPGAASQVGPSLRGFAGRGYIAGVVPNTPSDLVAWIRTPHAIAPRTAMPETGVSEADARDIASYLYTLR